MVFRQTYLDHLQTLLKITRQIRKDNRVNVQFIQIHLEKKKNINRINKKRNKKEIKLILTDPNSELKKRITLNLKDGKQT